MRAFAQHGFRGASIANIAEEAQISEPGLLHHYPSKRDLLFGVLERPETQSHAWAATDTDSGVGVEELMTGIAQSHETDPTFIRFFLVLAAESLNPSHPAHQWFQARYDRTQRAFASWLEADQARGRIRTDIDPMLASQLLIAALDGLELQHLLAPADGSIAGPLQLFLDHLRP
jgi:AcrR family transcriptional regulator